MAPLTPTVLDLPADIWQCLVTAILWVDGSKRDRGSDDFEFPSGHRHLDLARLAWTCRDAYAHIRPHLWSTLNLALSTERAQYPNPWLSPFVRQMLVDHFTIRGETVMPHSKASVVNGKWWTLEQRIRNTCTAFPFLPAPFAVLDGKLFIASLTQNPGPDPNYSGTRTLWAIPTDTHVETRIVSGLSLVEYPIHLVTSVVIDLLDMALRPIPKLDILGKCAFLQSPTLRQSVTSLRLLASYPSAGARGLHARLAGQYTNLTNVQCHFMGGNRLRTLTLPQCARTASVMSEWALDGGEAMRRAMGLVQFELLGIGTFSVKGWLRARQVAFGSATLTSLVVDFDTDVSQIERQHVPKAYSFPALVSLSVTLDLARVLFGQELPPRPEKAFPRLMHLKLLDTSLEQHYYPDDFDATSSRFDFTDLPFNHMPQLASISHPANHRQCPNTSSIKVSQLESMFTLCSRLTSLSLPGLCSVRAIAGNQPTSTTLIPPARLPVYGLHKAHLRATHAAILANVFAFPNLARLTLLMDMLPRDTFAFILVCTSTTLTDLTLHIPAVSRDPRIWPTLSKHARNLRQLRILKGMDATGRSWVVDASALDTLALGVALDHDEFIESQPTTVGLYEDWIELDLEKCLLGGSGQASAGLASMTAAAHAMNTELRAEALARRKTAVGPGAREHPTYPLPTLASLHVTHDALTLFKLDLPSLTHLTVVASRLANLTRVFPQLARLTVIGCPTLPVMRQHMLELIPAACHVTIVHVAPRPPPAARAPAAPTRSRGRGRGRGRGGWNAGSGATRPAQISPKRVVPDAVQDLTLHFAGKEHVHTWQEVGKWDALEDGAVRESVTVTVAGEVSEAAAKTVAKVVAHVMGRHTIRVELRVVWSSGPAVDAAWCKEQVERVWRAVSERDDVGGWLHQSMNGESV